MKYTGNYKIRWTDKDSKQWSKVYTDYQTALKAKKWLIGQGIEIIDIAVEVKDNKNPSLDTKS